MEFQDETHCFFSLAAFGDFFIVCVTGQEHEVSAYAYWCPRELVPFRTSKSCEGLVTEPDWQMVHRYVSPSGGKGFISFREYI